MNNLYRQLECLLCVITINSTRLVGYLSYHVLLWHFAGFMLSGSRGKHFFFGDFMIKSAIKKYQELTEKKIHFILGAKGIEKHVVLKFTNKELYHLLGIHKLQDLNRRTLKEIRKNLNSFYISSSHIRLIQNSKHFDQIRERIDSVNMMYENLSNKDNRLYFHSNKDSTNFSKIKWDYLVRFENNHGQGLYFFKIVNDALIEELCCTSTFYNQSDSYYKRQKEWKILQINVESHDELFNVYTSNSYIHQK